jgi:hypothetical protein
MADPVVKNKGTSVPGILLFAGGLLTAIAQIWVGETPNLEGLMASFIAMLSGFGLVKADGGL